MVAEEVQLVRELIAIMKRPGAHHDPGEGGWFLDDVVRPRVREIGERLATLKKDDRDYFSWFFSCETLTWPRGAAHELELVWDAVTPEFRA